MPLSARNFDLLVYMVENCGRVLEHDELLEKVWAGTFVEQATLKKGISALRQILAEDADHEYIKTIPRRGYSFVSPVRVLPEENALVYTREIEREIIVEEYEEIDEPENELPAAPELIMLPPAPAALNALPAPETGSRSLPRMAVYAGAALVVLVLAFFGLKPYFAKSAPQYFSAENVRITRITNSGNVLGGTFASADGNYLLYPSPEKDGVALWLRQILSNGTKKLTQPRQGSYWGGAIAPDNSYVYYIFNDVLEPEKTGLYKMPLLGGEAQRITQNVGTMAISPDGKQLVVVRINGDTTIFSMTSNGDNEKPVISYPGGSRLWSVRFTPDGNSLICAVRKTIADKMVFYVEEVSLADGRETILIPEQDRVIYGADWFPDKNSILLVAREANADIRQLWQFYPSTNEWRRVTNDNNSYKAVNITSDGKTITTSQESRLGAIWVGNGAIPSSNSTDQKTSVIGRDNFRHITDGISSFDRLGWLADERLFYSATENGKETVFTINADGSNAYPITSGEDGIWISPNNGGGGRSIGFLSSRTGAKEVWRIDPDAKNLTQLTSLNTQIFEARILRDNATVLYLTQGKNGLAQLFKQTPDGRITELTDTETSRFAVSPDEKLFAAEVVDKNTKKAYVEMFSLEDGTSIRKFNILISRQLSFTPDGKNLAYDQKNGDAGQIMLQPIEGGDPRPLTDFQSEEIFSFDWSADGSRLAVIRGRQLIDAVQIKSSLR